MLMNSKLGHSLQVEILNNDTLGFNDESNRKQYLDVIQVTALLEHCTSNTAI